MPLLEVRDLRVGFDTRDGWLSAVDGVTFALEAGETLGLVGESGCGKSVTALTLMRLLASPPGRVLGGEVRFEGRDILAMSEREVRDLRGNAIAMIFQDPMTSLNPVMTVGRQITEVIQLHMKVGSSQARSRAVELLDMVGIPDARLRLGAYPHQFSGGMRQRVMIAMALSCSPRLVIADEITTALDVTIQAQILDVLRTLAKELTTSFILITHDLGIVAGMADRVHVMYAGRIVENAVTADLYADPRMPYTWGLLRSIPRLDEQLRRRLVPIEGLPPDLVAQSSGCRFEPRCPYRRLICEEVEPALAATPQADPGHLSRCWGTQHLDGGGWLVGKDWRQVTEVPTAPGTATRFRSGRLSSRP